MKNNTLLKAFSVLLVLALALCMTACGETDNESDADSVDTITSIEIGGDFDPIAFEGKAVGSEYSEIEMPEWFEVVDGDNDLMYYCEGCDTPYIAVANHTKGDKSFEEVVAGDSERWGDGYYQMINEKIGYYIQSAETAEGDLYYGASLAYDLGDTVKTVVFYAATEEAQIGDSDLYFNAATGYDELLPDEVFNASFGGEYDESYYFPNIWALNSFEGYDMEKKYFSFLKEWNMAEEQYNSWAENWTEETTTAYFNALGFEVVHTDFIEGDGYNVYSYGVTTDNSTGSKYETFSYIERNGKWYLINTWTTLTEPIPAYLTAIIDSIHVK